MVAVKAKYENGRIVLPPDAPRREPCEVTALFPGQHAPLISAEDFEKARETLRKELGINLHII